MTEESEMLIVAVGWIYTLAWSLSFYGQIYENYKAKNVEGMNLDFVCLNFTGFFFYSLYNSYGYFIDKKQTGEVDFNDCIFAYHATFATLICVFQALIYPKGENKVHLPTKILLVLMWLFVIIYGFFNRHSLKHFVAQHPHLGVFSFMGYFKVMITLIKYLPQMYWNYVRKSTEGWSIFNIQMDMTGGIFSFTQMGLELLLIPNTLINMVKVLLGSATMIYDSIFILQHYKWYRKDDNEQKYQQSFEEMTEATAH